MAAVNLGASSPVKADKTENSSELFGRALNRAKNEFNNNEVNFIVDDVIFGKTEPEAAANSIREMEQNAVNNGVLDSNIIQGALNYTLENIDLENEFSEDEPTDEAVRLQQLLEALED